MHGEKRLCNEGASPVLMRKAEVVEDECLGCVFYWECDSPCYNYYAKLFGKEVKPFKM
jgi:hypothetical protein